ncbi:MAG: hypothetical protein OHK0021_07000 [Bryobacter sp.]
MGTVSNEDNFEKMRRGIDEMAKQKKQPATEVNRFETFADPTGTAQIGTGIPEDFQVKSHAGNL